MPPPNPAGAPEIIDGTESLCPVCLAVIEATVVIEDGRVWIRKSCEAHGTFTSPHLWEAPAIYRKLRSLLPARTLPANGLVLNVTSDCNLSCPYCFARAKESTTQALDLAEIDAILAGYPGRIVYLSGGEPTMHPQLGEIVRHLKARGYAVGLFSNGVRLAEPELVDALDAAGLDFVILQFDSLNEERTGVLRKPDILTKKLAALENLGRRGLAVYLFVMLVAGVNRDEIGGLLRFAAARQDTVKIINFNPVWEVGRRAAHGELSASTVAGLVAAELGVSERDFLLATELSLQAGELRARLSSSPVRSHPICELRCYGMFVGERFVGLAEVLDLPRLNRLLGILLQGPAGRARTLLRLLWHLPILAAIGLWHLVSRSAFRTFVRRWLARLMSRAGRRRSLFAASPLTSVIVGTFHTPANTDLAFQRSCNLFSHLPGDNQIVPACARQIIVDRLAAVGAGGGRSSAEIGRSLRGALGHSADPRERGRPDPTR
jgi:pyruvate-formate lyase-activating enzyme